MITISLFCSFSSSSSTTWSWEICVFIAIIHGIANTQQHKERRNLSKLRELEEHTTLYTGVDLPWEAASTLDTMLMMMRQQQQQKSGEGRRGEKNWSLNCYESLLTWYYQWIESWRRNFWHYKEISADLGPIVYLVHRSSASGEFLSIVNMLVVQVSDTHSGGGGRSSRPRDRRGVLGRFHNFNLLSKLNFILRFEGASTRNWARKSPKKYKNWIRAYAQRVLMFRSTF